jgi:hypothetical protein
MWETHDLTKPIKIIGRFGIYQNLGYLWGIAEIVGPTGLWIDYPCTLSKEQAIARCHELYSKEPPC